MNKSLSQRPTLPVLDGRALDFIKICAVVFMVIDHINFCLLQQQSLNMMLIGRAAFPLFCYGLAVAMLRVGPEKSPTYGLRNYGRRLLVFAVLAEPVSYFVRNIGEANILFTLALGGILAGISPKLKNGQLYALQLAAVVLNFAPHPVEFGAAGIALPSALLAVMQQRKGALRMLLLLLFAINADATAFSSGAAAADSVFALALLGGFATLLPFGVLKMAEFFPADGRYLHKYALHVFYPLHLLVLWAIGHYVMNVPGAW